MQSNNGKTTFRCPFETKAKAEGKILEVTLFGDQSNRLELMRVGFDTFYTDLSLAALTFVLPKEVFKEGMSLEDLRSAVVSYQFELVAAEISYRFDPFLYSESSHSVAFMSEEQKRSDDIVMVNAFLKLFTEESLEKPRKTEDLILLFEKIFIPMINEGKHQPTLSLAMGSGKKCYHESLFLVYWLSIKTTNTEPTKS